MRSRRGPPSTESTPRSRSVPCRLPVDRSGGRGGWRVAGRSGLASHRARHGNGGISAFTSDEPLVNASIGRARQRRVRGALAAPRASGRGPIWIFFEGDWPSVFGLLRRHAAPALIAGAALLALWLWSPSFRFGPLLPAPPPARRCWLEHLEAAGRFHWRQDHGAALLLSLRDELERGSGASGPGWSRLPERERLERPSAGQRAALRARRARALRGADRRERLHRRGRALERFRAVL